MHINFDRFDKLVAESGKSKAYLSCCISKTVFYFHDAKRANENIPDDIVKICTSGFYTVD